MNQQYIIQTGLYDQFGIYRPFIPVPYLVTGVYSQPPMPIVDDQFNQYWKCESKHLPDSRHSQNINNENLIIRETKNSTNFYFTASEFPDTWGKEANNLSNLVKDDISIRAPYKPEQSLNMKTDDIQNTLYYENNLPIKTSIPIKDLMKDNYGFEDSRPTKRLSNLTKSKINTKLLKDYNCRIEKRTNDKGGVTTVYICNYNGWDKEFTRTWSILDHVRMHEGVRPYVCKIWARTYTQKGNMLKHMKRHTEPNVESRRNYSCEHCDRWYTEKYNLKTHQKKFHPEIFKNMTKTQNSYN